MTDGLHGVGGGDYKAIQGLFDLWIVVSSEPSLKTESKIIVHTVVQTHKNFAILYCLVYFQDKRNGIHEAFGKSVESESESI